MTGVLDGLGSDSKMQKTRKATNAQKRNFFITFQGTGKAGAETADFTPSKVLNGGALAG